jgi:hypothetical protein
MVDIQTTGRPIGCQDDLELDTYSPNVEHKNNSDKFYFICKFNKLPARAYSLPRVHSACYQRRSKSRMNPRRTGAPESVVGWSRHSIRVFGR